MSAVTASDLVSLALAETDPAKQHALLVKAEALALASTTMRAHDLLSIAACHVDASNKEGARRCIERVLGDASGEIWNYRTPAKLWMALAEPVRAREALEACEAAFRDRDTQGYQWRLLAEGWAVDIGEVRDAVRCLAHATVSATTVDDHCSVARGLYDLVGDVDGAREALGRAESAAEAEGGRHDWWTLANAYSAIGDLERTRAALERGTRASRSVDEYVTMAAAWNSQFPSGAGVRDSLTHAAACARTTQQWMQVADAHADYTRDAASIRKCLNDALDVATTAGDRRRVARGFRQFLNDPVTADAIAPPGLPPDEVATERVSVGPWQADAAALLDWLRPKATPEILREIAAADYGMDAEKNLPILEEIVRTGLVPHPLEWCPLEVLHLSRWDEGARVDHIKRAFVCTLLCIEGTAIDSDGSEADIVILLESCLELGRATSAPLVGLLVALVEATAHAMADDEPPLFSSAPLLALLLTAGAVDPADPRLDALAELLLGQPDALVDLFVDGMRPKVWRRIVDETMPTMLAARPPSNAFQGLAELFELLQ